MTEKFIEDHIDLPWDWGIMDCNPSITINFALRHANKMDWVSVSRFMKLNIDIILDHQNAPWVWDQLIFNPSLSLKDILSHPELPFSNYVQMGERDIVAHAYWVSKDPDITIDIILNNPMADWAWRDLSANLSIKLDDILANQQLPWISKTVSNRSDLTLEYLFEHYRDYPWTWHDMKILRYLTLEDILKYQPLLNEMAQGRALSFDTVNFHEVINHPLIINKRGLISSATMTLKDILSHPEIDWFWGFICGFYYITIEDLTNHPDVNWLWPALSHNSSFTMDDIENNMHLPWVLKYVLLNPNITTGFIDRNIKLSRDVFEMLSKNRPNCDNHIKFALTIKQTAQIHDELMRITWHPTRVIDWCFDEEGKKSVSKFNAHVLNQ